VKIKIEEARNKAHPQPFPGEGCVATCEFKAEELKLFMGGYLLF
jgi:hypothetical protein